MVDEVIHFERRRWGRNWHRLDVVGEHRAIGQFFEPAQISPPEGRVLIKIKHIGIRGAGGTVDIAAEVHIIGKQPVMPMCA